VQSKVAMKRTSATAIVLILPALVFTSAGRAENMSDENVKRMAAIAWVAGCTLGGADNYLRNRDNTRVLTGDDKQDQAEIMRLEQEMATSVLDPCMTQLQIREREIASLFHSPDEQRTFLDGAAFALRSVMLQKIITEDRRIGGKGPSWESLVNSAGAMIWLWLAGIGFVNRRVGRNGISTSEPAAAGLGAHGQTSRR